MLPDSVWQAEITPQDISAVVGMMQSAAAELARKHAFTFHDGNYALVGNVNLSTFKAAARLKWTMCNGGWMINTRLCGAKQIASRTFLREACCFNSGSHP